MYNQEQFAQMLSNRPALFEEYFVLWKYCAYLQIFDLNATYCVRFIWNAILSATVVVANL